VTTLERLERWKTAGIITEPQQRSLAALVRKERFSLFVELNVLFYLGVISLVGGLGWTFTTYFERLGDFFILGVLSTMLAASLYYCFSRVATYSNEQVESPNFVLDYVLYLACLLLSVELGYIEFRFQWLKDAWDSYLLFSSVIFFVFAYRFDNRFVLSLALSTLAGWFGLKVSRYGFVSSEPMRLSGLVYASIVAIVGVFMHRQKIKRHFLETYLHIATTVTYLSLISGLWGNTESIYLMAILVLSVTAVALGIRFKRFAFVVYGMVFAYLAISVKAVHVMDDTTMFAYFVATGCAVITLLVLLARRFGKES
jgi:hypothetical protein